ncbi:NUDIX hydrolase [Candidatus Haliotispira prima]|uniref:GDP-mannose pyrophosphatase n=1 Tax=Candidatus Haliotispira prima TaxID=3034016 RepID=A0ABY8MH76_9SPIO|nr:NUDIX hydrolase [Candidatus Haliotispira prima]
MALRKPFPFRINRKLRWHVLDREAIFRSPVFTMFRSTRLFPCPEFGPEEKRGDFYYFDSNDWVTVIPLIRNQETGQYDVVLVEQFRHGSEQPVLEFPAGVIDKGEEPQHCALREMAEETGYGEESVLRFEQIGVSYPNPAIMSNRTFTYGVILDENAVQKELFLDELEALQTHRLPIAELKGLILCHASPFNNALMLQAMFWLENAKLFHSL